MHAAAHAQGWHQRIGLKKPSKQLCMHANSACTWVQVCPHGSTYADVIARAPQLLRHRPGGSCTATRRHVCSLSVSLIVPELQIRRHLRCIKPSSLHDRNKMDIIKETRHKQLIKFITFIEPRTSHLAHEAPVLVEVCLNIVHRNWGRRCHDELTRSTLTAALSCRMGARASERADLLPAGSIMCEISRLNFDACNAH